MQGTIQTLFTNWLNIGTAVAAIIIAFYLMWAGYLLLTSGGNPQQVLRAKEAFWHAVAGGVIVLAAQAIAAAV